MFGRIALAGGVALVAYLGLWALVGYAAFRRGDEEALGRLDLRALIATVLIAAGFAAAPARYLPDPVVIAALAAFFGVSVVTDLRLWTIYDGSVIVLLAFGVFDAIVRGRVLDSTVGIVAAGCVVFAAFRTGIVKQGDVKAALAVGVALGGFFGLAAIAGGLIAVTAIQLVRQSQSRLPVTTRVPWSPLLACGTFAALVIEVSPLAHFFAVSAP